MPLCSENILGPKFANIRPYDIFGNLFASNLPVLAGWQQRQMTIDIDQSQFRKTGTLYYRAPRGNILFCLGSKGLHSIGENLTINCSTFG